MSESGVPYSVGDSVASAVAAAGLLEHDPAVLPGVSAAQDAVSAVAEEVVEPAAVEASEPSDVASPVLSPPVPQPAVSPGEMVEYCLPDGYRQGEWRPALLIKEWQPGYWSLAVFADGGNDGLPCPWWIPTVLYGDGPGHWRLVVSG